MVISARPEHRYYNPQWRRFISPDDTAYLDPNAINGLNLYCYCSNNPITARSETKQQPKQFATLYHQAENKEFYKKPKATVGAINGNSLGLRWENKWFDTDWPSFLVVSKDDFELVNWNLSAYRGTLSFDAVNQHSIYLAAGNVGVYAGVNFEKGIGVEASANVVEIGYDGQIFDVSLEGLSVGFTYMYKKGHFKLKHGYGWWGWSISVDFVGLWDYLF